MKEHVLLNGQFINREAIQWTKIQQHYTYNCIKCSCTTRSLSYEKSPQIEFLHRCKECGFSMKEARQKGRLKKVVKLLSEAKELLQNAKTST